jgi:hypothetical protein
MRDSRPHRLRAVAADVVAQSALQRGIAVERAETAGHLAGAGKQDDMPGDQRLLGDVLCQR